MVGKPEQIIEAGKKTQFKKGNKAAVGNMGPNTYRAQLAWIREQDIDPRDLDGSLKKLKEQKIIKVGRSGSKKNAVRINMTRLVAICALEKLLKNMDPTLFKEIINQTEGNLQQEIVIPTTIEAPTDFTTPEEAAAAYKNHVAK